MVSQLGCHLDGNLSPVSPLRILPCSGSRESRLVAPLLFFSSPQPGPLAQGVVAHELCGVHVRSSGLRTFQHREGAIRSCQWGEGRGGRGGFSEDIFWVGQGRRIRAHNSFRVWGVPIPYLQRQPKRGNETSDKDPDIQAIHFKSWTRLGHLERGLIFVSSPKSRVKIHTHLKLVWYLHQTEPLRQLTSGRFGFPALPRKDAWRERCLSKAHLGRSKKQMRLIWPIRASLFRFLCLS